MGYRPLKLPKGWIKMTASELIKKIEEYLYSFTETEAWDSGVRLSETEAYLQGLEDAKKLFKNEL